MGNHQRDLRLRSGLKLDALADIVKEVHPNFDKTLLSKCENPEKYGVKLDYQTFKLLYQAADPEGWEKYKRHTDGHRLRKRVYFRMSDETFDRLKQQLKGDGYTSFQEWGTVLIYRYLSSKTERPKDEPDS